MRERRVRAVPVVDNGSVRGLINMRILAERYLDETEVRGFARGAVSVGSLCKRARRTTSRRAMPDPSCPVTYSSGRWSRSTMRGHIKPGDTLLVGDRKRTQPMALEAGVACLVVTGGAEPELEALEMARERGAAVIVTAHDTFAAARLVNLSAQRGSTPWTRASRTSSPTRCCPRRPRTCSQARTARRSWLMATAGSSASSRARTSHAARDVVSCSSTTTRLRSRRPASTRLRLSRSWITTAWATCRPSGRSCSSTCRSARPRRSSRSGTSNSTSKRPSRWPGYCSRPC